MGKFQNKYRITTSRAPFWCYGDNALYFITICTKNRVHWFGEITQKKNELPQMTLSEIGQIVLSEWLRTFELRPDMNLFMGEFVVMPDHFHAIIGIGENEYNRNSIKNQFGSQSKNLASIIRGFKSAVTMAARQINSDFQWQSRFHDSILRNHHAFDTISSYIIDNPKNWGKKNKIKMC